MFFFYSVCFTSLFFCGVFSRFVVFVFVVAVVADNKSGKVFAAELLIRPVSHTHTHTHSHSLRDGQRARFVCFFFAVCVAGDVQKTNKIIVKN